MKKTGLYGLLLTLVVCFHCSETGKPDRACPVAAVSGSDDDVVGKWQLVKVHTVFTIEGDKIADHSCNNTVYDFQKDGILIISSDREEYQDTSIGEYNYEFKLQPLYENYGLSYTLKIEHMEYACGISEDNMTLDSSPLDGPVLYFVRIQ